MGDEIACYVASDSGILKYLTSGSGLAYRRLWNRRTGLALLGENWNRMLRY